MLAVEGCGAKRNPVLGSGAGEVVLGQVGPVAGRGGVGAEQGEGAAVAPPAQHLGAGEAGGAGADDDHPGRMHGGIRPPGGRRREAGADQDTVALDLDGPAFEGIEGGGGEGLAAAQVEAGVVPGAAHGVADHQAFGQRSAVVGAGAGDGEQAVGAPHQQHRLARDVA